MPRNDEGSITFPAPVRKPHKRLRPKHYAQLVDGARVVKEIPLSCRYPRAYKAFKRLQAIYGRENVRFEPASGAAR